MAFDLAALKNIPGLSAVPQGQRDCGRFGLYGPPGTGKTYQASSLAAYGPQLFVDMPGEKGTRSFQGAPWTKNITVVRPDSVTAMDDLFYFLDAGDHPFKSVVVDSGTSMQKMTMRYLQNQDETAVREIKQGGAPASMQTWGRALDVMSDLGIYWTSLADGDRKSPMHVALLFQEKVNTNEFTGETQRTIDVQKGAVNAILANLDYVMYTMTEPNPEIVDDYDPPMIHTMLFGAHPGYVTKARVPTNLVGQIPPVLGRDKRVTLAGLARDLEIGGTGTKKEAKTDGAS